MADIIYSYGGKPYLNITNQCPCACVFCIRGQAEGLGSAANLWHHADPSWEEIETALAAFDFSGAGEVVFCGYGEPFCALDHLRRAAVWLKEHFPALKLRVNTNGLGDLIYQRDTSKDLAGLVDTVSISLNAPNAALYQQICRCAYGEAAFGAMLLFARHCKEVYPNVIFSVVDVLSEETLSECRALASSMGIPLRVRRRA
ncbi:MAG: TIGR04100 family radical SAM protein [Oscillospiraceae bacterium]|jgi:radical SAM enzyme (TIGR04100 family)|nr:TIGR04100 family radical SAM protein [Oscillospiraceae bacterium]